MLKNNISFIFFLIMLSSILQCYENHNSHLINIAINSDYNKESLDKFREKINLFNKTITLEEKYNILSRKDIWFLNYLYNNSENNITDLYHLNIRKNINKKNIKKIFDLEFSFFEIYIKDFMDNMTLVQILAIKSFINKRRE